MFQLLLKLLASLPQGTAIVIGTVALSTGVIGAAVTVGDEDVSGSMQSFFSALGLSVDDDDDDNEHGATATATAGWVKKKATATGTAVPGKDLPSASSIPGLCRAFDSGSEHGRERKLEATAFKRLQNAADAAGAEELEDFCETVLASRKATAVATAAAGESSRGKHDDDDDDKHGKSDERRQGYNPFSSGGNFSAASTPEPKRPSSDSSRKEEQRESSSRSGGGERSSSGRR
jgi:hypothetical protein